MKKIIWKENFIDINEEYLDDLKKNYYMKLGAYKQKFEDIKNQLNSIESIVNSDQTKNVFLSIFARRSTQGTEELEGKKPDIDLLEENLYNSKLSKNSELGISLDILEMYLHYDFPEIITIESIKEIHKKFFKSKSLEYKAGRFRNKNDNNVMIKSSDKEFVNSSLVSKNMDKFMLYLNTLNNYELITKAAIIHGIFIGIHPFKDGNGRVGRFIVDKLISKELGIPLFLSDAINNRSNDSTYFSVLDSFHLNLESNGLIRYFYEISIDQLKSNIKLLNEYIIEFKKFKKSLLKKGFKTEYSIGLSELFTSKKYVINKDISERLNITSVTSTKLLNELMNKKIIKIYKKNGKSILYKKIVN